MRSSFLLLVFVLGVVSLTTTSCSCDDVDECEMPAMVDPEPIQNRVGVNTNSTGEDVPQSYTAVLTRVGSSTPLTMVVGSNSQDSFRDVPPGSYTLGLTGVPENCTVQGDSPRPITDVHSQTNQFYNFDVVCAAHVGSIHLFNETNGDPMTPEYTVRVSGVRLSGPPVNIIVETRPFPPGFNLFFNAVVVGDQQVEIDDIPAHCFLFGDPTRIVSVSFQEQTSETFRIDCTGQNGEIRVVTVTTGVDVDPDGYFVNVAGQNIVFANDFSYDFAPLPAGDHEVTLLNVAPNCAVNGDNPRTVVVEVSERTVTTFEVVCTTITGALEVTTITSGTPDPDAYIVSVDGQDVPIGVNEVQLVEGIAPGDRQVTLGDVANDCAVTAPNPRTVEIPGNATAFTTFEVACPEPTPPVLFESDRDGDFEIYAMNPDGSGVVQLTDNDFADEDPSWSWDNQHIIFRSTRGGQGDIWMMDADGSNPVQITDNPEDNQDPAFSPDGTQIVYEQETGVGNGDLEIFIDDVNGGSPLQLTNAAGISEGPSFNPDGSRILFKSDRDGDFEVYTQDPDALNSNVSKLTNTNVDDFDPSWFPDGSQITFSSQRAQPEREDLWIMNANGSGQTRILFDNVWDWHPVFSTDGGRIIFTSDRDGDYELFRMNANGTGVEQLTNNGARDNDAEYQKPAN